MAASWQGLLSRGPFPGRPARPGQALLHIPADERRAEWRMMLTDDEFNLFSTLIYNESGITIKESKKEYLQAKLQKRLQAHRLGSYFRYYKFVSDKANGQRELLDLVDSLTINETSFFRNKPQFDLFADMVIPELRARKANDMKIRIWSAGCSTGQEAYSIAMFLLSRLEYPKAWDIRILASDISYRVLESAQRGIYSDHEMASVGPEYRMEFFDAMNGRYRIKPAVKNLVVFDYHNLKHENGFADMDVIFCRNVMIYFDRDGQKRLVEKFHMSLSENGCLFLGHSETMHGLSDKFRFIHQNKGTMYRKAA
jgi:chemotaxis protein methyltransferase CheR